MLDSVQATGTSAMNTVMASLYQEGFFIRAYKAERIAKLWLLFLQKYALAAHICYSRGLRRFALVPKHHYLHHGCIRLLREAQRALRDSGGWALSPLGESVQMEEDFIGRPSRMSRRVNPKRIHYRVCQRTLISAMIALKQSDKDDRGLFTSHFLWAFNQSQLLDIATAVPLTKGCKLLPFVLTNGIWWGKKVRKFSKDGKLAMICDDIS